MLRETCGVSATLCAQVPALLPLFQPGLPVTHDGFLHVQRIIALEAALRQGTPFTRWLPDLAYGYGQPLLLYYAPLSYLPALLLRVLGAGYGLSFQVAEGLALVLAALAMYLLARAFVGPVAACVAAAVYGLLPYQLVDVYVRGALAESWAFVWLPLASWCLLRAWQDRRRRWSVGLALSVAGLVLTHNVTALLFLPALVALALVLLAGERGATWRAHWPIAAALALGLALSAWFWLPALAEKGLVQINETLEPDLFASYLLRSWPPFQVGPIFDYEHPVSVALGSPIYWPQVGLVQVLATLAGAVAALRARGSTRRLAIWSGLLVAGGMILQAASMAPAYNLIPLLAFVQFPWRMLALVGLGSAILAGVLVEAASTRIDFRAVLAVLVIGGSLATAVAGLHPEMAPVDEHALSVETINRIELADDGLGSTHSGEYLPVSSGQRNAARFRKTMLDAGGGTGRQAQARNSDLKVNAVDWRADRVTLEVEAAAPDRLTLHQFAFPGWTAQVDGQAAPIQAAGQVGLLAVDVPPGRHTIEVAWGLTPLRWLAAAVSLASPIVLAVLGSGTVRTLKRRPVVLGVAAAGLLGVLMLPGWSAMVPAASGPPSSAPRPDGAMASTADAGLALIDVQEDASRLASDRLALVRLTWLVRATPTTGYRAAIEARAANGTIHRAPWTYEPDSRLWERGEVVPTTVAIRLPADFPIGDARLRLVFERPEGGAPIDLGTLAVPRLRRASFLSGPDASVSDGPSVEVGPDLRVSQAAAANRSPYGPLQVRPGGYLDLPLRWQALGATPDVKRDLVAVAALRTPSVELLSEPGRPGDWFSPLPFWQQGETVGQRLRIAVPAGTPAGVYPLSVRIYERELARGGAAESGASSSRPRGRPAAELMLGPVTVAP
jgi:hypothetical protein